MLRLAPVDGDPVVQTREAVQTPRPERDAPGIPREEHLQRADALERAFALLKDGAITRAEYQRWKGEILAGERNSGLARGS